MENKIEQVLKASDHTGLLSPNTARKGEGLAERVAGVLRTTAGTAGQPSEAVGATLTADKGREKGKRKNKNKPSRADRRRRALQRGEAETPETPRRPHSESSTPREVKRRGVDGALKGYSRAVATSLKMAIVPAA